MYLWSNSATVCEMAFENGFASKPFLISFRGRRYSRTFLIYLFLRFAGVSYGRFMAMRCRLICQSIFRTVDDRYEGRDLNGETVGS